MEPLGFTDRINIVKIAILPKPSTAPTQNPIKITKASFTDIEETILKLCGTTKTLKPEQC